MTRSKRRFFVALMYASYITIAILPGFARGQSGLLATLGFTATGVAGILLFGCWLALTGLLHEYGFPGDHRLFTSRDERQTAVRHRAFVRAYAILAALLCAACVYSAIAFDAGFWIPDAGARHPILFGLVFLTASLPSAVIAWTEPDPA